MSAKKAILIGCGVVAVLAVLLLVIIFAGLAHISKDVEGVSLAVNAPLDVTVGETFDLAVEIKNEREKKALALSDIDISDAYLAGFAIISTEPTAKSSMLIEDPDMRSYTLEISIPPGEAKTFTLKLRAEKAGMYRGDIDVCEGLRFITIAAQTVVRDQ